MYTNRVRWVLDSHLTYVATIRKKGICGWRCHTKTIITINDNHLSWRLKNDDDDDEDADGDDDKLFKDKHSTLYSVFWYLLLHSFSLFFHHELEGQLNDDGRTRLTNDNNNEQRSPVFFCLCSAFIFYWRWTSWTTTTFHRRLSATTSYRLFLSTQWINKL